MDPINLKKEAIQNQISSQEELDIKNKEYFKTEFVEKVELLDTNTEDGLFMLKYLYKNVYMALKDKEDIDSFINNSSIQQKLFNILENNSLDNLGYEITYNIILLLFYTANKQSNFIEKYKSEEFLQYLTEVIMKFNTPEMVDISLSLIFRLVSFQLESFKIPPNLWFILLALTNSGKSNHKRTVFAIISYLLPTFDDIEVILQLSLIFLNALQNDYIAIKIQSVKFLYDIITKFPEIRKDLISNNMIEIIVSIFPTITIGSVMFFMYAIDIFIDITEKGDNCDITRLLDSNALGFFINNDEIFSIDSKFDVEKWDLQKNILKLIILLVQKEDRDIISYLLSMNIIEKVYLLYQKEITSMNEEINIFFYHIILLRDNDLITCVINLDIFDRLFVDISEHNDSYILLSFMAIEIVLEIASSQKQKLIDCDVIKEIQSSIEGEHMQEIYDYGEQLLSLLE